LLSGLIVVVLVGFWLTWQTLVRIERRMDEIETLINSLGGIVGAYIDAMEGDDK